MNPGVEHSDRIDPNESDVDLRLKGKTVTRCCIDYTFSLEFYEEHHRTVIRIGGTMNIEAAGTHLRLSGQKPTESPQACVLFGKTVQDSVGRKDGSLYLGFADGSKLIVLPDQEYEAWEASADDGFLVVSVPAED